MNGDITAIEIHQSLRSVLTAIEAYRNNILAKFALRAHSINSEGAGTENYHLKIHTIKERNPHQCFLRRIQTSMEIMADMVTKN